MKVQLILIDGMRPDSLEKCGNPYIAELLQDSLSTMEARTVVPSVTLPCHMSLFHSVDPARHGVTTNLYTPQVRPIDGLMEQLHKGKKLTGSFYNWAELRDLYRPGSSTCDHLFDLHVLGPERSHRLTVAASEHYRRELDLDFTFTYMGWSDEAGHASGWMSEDYLHAVSESWNSVRQLIDAAGDDCVTIITADHGGHDRTHGTELPEDMTIPVVIHGMGLQGKLEGHVSIKDIAPTVAKLLGCECAPEWEGRSLV